MDRKQPKAGQKWMIRRLMDCVDANPLPQNQSPNQRAGSSPALGTSFPQRVTGSVRSPNGTAE
jgi:hypothetical protein